MKPMKVKRLSDGMPTERKQGQGLIFKGINDQVDFCRPKDPEG